MLDLQICVPALGADGLSEACAGLRLLKIRPDHGGTLKTRHMRHLRVDLDFAIVLSKLQLLLGAQILIAEENNTPLGDEQCKLISLLVGEIFQLQTDDLCADVFRQVLDFLRGRKQGGLVGVGTGAGVDILAVFVADGVDVLKVKRACRAVLRAKSIYVVLSLRKLDALDSLRSDQCRPSRVLLWLDQEG